MSQITLFDTAPHPRARAGDTATALEAARSVTPGRTEALILDLFARMGGPMTDDQIAARLPECYPPTVKSARSRLTAMGLLVDSGERRPSGRGRTMIAWAVA